MARSFDPTIAPVDVTTLATMSREDLHDLWRRLHRKPPPRGLVGDLLRRALVWRLQSAQQGVHEIELWKRLAREARQAERRLALCADKSREKDGRDKPEPRRKLRPGTRLIREWKGEIHEVVVLKDGFLWKGTSHRSLSVIARLISGTNWNGWLFFGITRPEAQETIEPSSKPVEQARRKGARLAPNEAAHA
ncbi:MAG: DUF2924 domain-containing protein [Beijerinckiaceae bacterium]|nr:DUF2924 domain-containing protein [Beijerinckiaceae bacterium]MCZ8298989.1 DUF2924 domain-containing protein [Beijerinckiaceae bacterium]